MQNSYHRWQSSPAAIGLGTWHGDDPSLQTQEINAIHAGLATGAEVIDTAEMYGLGRAENVGWQSH